MAVAGQPRRAGRSGGPAAVEFFLPAPLATRGPRPRAWRHHHPLRPTAGLFPRRPAFRATHGLRHALLFRRPVIPGRCRQAAYPPRKRIAEGRLGAGENRHGWSGEYAGNRSAAVQTVRRWHCQAGAEEHQCRHSVRRKTGTPVRVGQTLAARHVQAQRRQHRYRGTGPDRDRRAVAAAGRRQWPADHFAPVAGHAGDDDCLRDTGESTHAGRATLAG